MLKHDPYGCEVDIWSLGVCLVLTAGFSHPFNSFSVRKIIFLCRNISRNFMMFAIKELEIYSIDCLSIGPRCLKTLSNDVCKLSRVNEPQRENYWNITFCAIVRCSQTLNLLLRISFCKMC
jgi:serine/threonine protein kinase